MPPYAITGDIPVVKKTADPTRPAIGNPVGPVGPVINTIRAIKDHAPAEIAELEGTIQVLRKRLSMALARKNLLEELVAVIADAEPLIQPVMLPPMTLMR